MGGPPNGRPYISPNDTVACFKYIPYARHTDLQPRAAGQRQVDVAASQRSAEGNSDEGHAKLEVSVVCRNDLLSCSRK